MLELEGNIWIVDNAYDAVVITTNGFVKENGEAVMGRGIAQQAAKEFRFLPISLGNRLTKHGNRVYLFEEYNRFWKKKRIITFPVKTDWRVRAHKDLIIKSTEQLVDLVDAVGFERIVMPRPGCGNGGLKWEDVKPIIEPYLDNRFTVMDYSS
jgi:hypothetical protein